MNTAPQTRMIAAGAITAGSNDRTVFDLAELRDLAASIAQHGLAQPPTVRPLPNDRFEIVAGERRFRAMTAVLGWNQIPCLVRPMNDEEAAGIMLAENTARKDLDPIDEARAYHRRMKEFGWSAEQCAERAGVGPQRVRRRVRLLNLEETTLGLVRSGQMPLSYAEFLAEAELDIHWQLLAMRAINDEERPSLAWFRSVVNQLAEKAKQCSMFGADDFFSAPPSRSAGDLINADSLPLPATGAAPIDGVDPALLLESHAAYWNRAAEQWAAYHKDWFAHQCRIVARALTHAAKSVSTIQTEAGV